jgi:hypothetical protein
MLKSCPEFLSPVRHNVPPRENRYIRQGAVSHKFNVNGSTFCLFKQKYTRNKIISGLVDGNSATRFAGISPIPHP